jgi:hypothetical protein
MSLIWTVENILKLVEAMTVRSELQISQYRGVMHLSRKVVVVTL